MFQETSRYYSLETATYTAPDGRTLSYKRRRFLPRSEDLTTLVEVMVAEGERLDLITQRTLGDPEQYWRVCDANDAMKPRELAEESGRTLKIPVPEV